MLHRIIAYLVLLLIVLLPTRGIAQIPDRFTNLKVLPADIEKTRLVELMKSFTRGLGVQCEYCHKGDADAPLSSFDFASDERPAKAKARLMIKMENDINEKYMTQIEPAEGRISVTCQTCHHGQSRPRSIQDVLIEVIEKESLEAGIRKYRDLRKNYYGSDTYDFSEDALNQLGRMLASQSKILDAIAVMRLNEEFFPQSGMVHFILGELYYKAEDNEQALEHYRKSLQSIPNNPVAKQKIEELSKKE